MNENREQMSENRKALPKFALIMAGSLLLGGLLGFAAGLTRVLDTAAFAQWLDRSIQAVTPWGIPVTSVLTLGGCFLLYRAAARKFAVWGGGDEDEASRSAGSLLSWALLLSAVQLVIDLFFMAAAAVYIEDDFSLITVALFLVSCGLVVFAQQKIVDLERRMNPEKHGSVYDMNFQKKWYGSCDESERRQIGLACYRAYMVTGRLCLGLWLILVILSMVFEISVLPAFILLLVWGTMQVTYTLESIRLSKKPSA